MGSSVGYRRPPVEHQFKPGRSGNPRGRPKGLARRIREAVGDDGEMLVEFWVAALRDGYIRHRHPQTGEEEYEKVSVRDQIAIATALADRGWGKAPAHDPIDDDAGGFRRGETEAEAQRRFDREREKEERFVAGITRAVEEWEERRRRWNEERGRRDGDAAGNGDDPQPPVA